VIGLEYHTERRDALGLPLRRARRLGTAKAYPTPPAPSAAAPETPADDKLDQILFALRQLEGQVQDLRMTLDELKAEKKPQAKKPPLKPKDPQ
jgi:hypothetical protein